MDFVQKFRQTDYRHIYDLSADGSTALVHDDATGCFYVKKLIDADASLYKRLMYLKIPYTPRIISVTENGDAAIVVHEFISGVTLENYIKTNGVMTFDEAKPYMLCLCNALSALHRNNIIHRDVTPSNIVITPDGKCFLIDFGIARANNGGAGKDTRVLGTAGFAAPEQFGFSRTDVRTDIYALGAILNIMLTGDLPSVSIPGGEAGEIIKKCTKLDPQDRYSDTEQLKKCFLTSVNNSSAVKRKSYKKPLKIALAISVLAICLIAEGIILAGIFSRNNAPSTAESTYAEKDDDTQSNSDSSEKENLPDNRSTPAPTVPDEEDSSDNSPQATPAAVFSDNSTTKTVLSSADELISSYSIEGLDFKFDHAEYITPTFGNKPADGKKYLAVWFEVQNNSTETKRLSSMYSSAYADDSYVNNTFLLDTAGSSFDSAVIHPDKKTTCCNVYEVDENWEKLEFIYEPSSMLFLPDSGSFRTAIYRSELNL